MPARGLTPTAKTNAAAPRLVRPKTLTTARFVCKLTQAKRQSRPPAQLAELPRRFPPQKAMGASSIQAEETPFSFPASPRNQAISAETLPCRRNWLARPGAHPRVPYAKV